MSAAWGRMMRAIRDNETAARAMGKDVTRRHLQIFILGSAVVGFAGAMMTTLDGQLTPSSYQPLRYTFLIWVMVIVGGSGNNWGAVLGGMVGLLVGAPVPVIGSLVTAFLGTFAGALMVTGLLCVLYNMWMTARVGSAYDEEKHLVPATAD